MVEADTDTPHAADIQKKPVSCFGDNNGTASIEGISGGTPPYLFALDQQPFTTENTFDALSPGIHTLLLQDLNGCTYETSFEIAEPAAWLIDLGPDTSIHFGDERLILVDRSRRVYVPNVFSPGTAENSMLTVYGGPDVARIQSFQIFDRWGEVVHEVLDFEKNDLRKGWDGSFRGQEVLPGVYVYVARVRFKDGKTELFRGDVTVIR